MEFLNVAEDDSDMVVNVWILSDMNRVHYQCIENCRAGVGKCYYRGAGS